MAAFEKAHSKNKLDIDEDISEIMSNMMCIRMAKRLHRDTVLILDYLINTHYVNINKCVKYHVGSLFEGTAIFGSDIDYLFLQKGLLICESKEEISCNKYDDVFLMDRTDCRPGYTKLKQIKNSCSDTLFLCDLFGEEEIIVVENTEMGTYLSTNKFMDVAVNTLNQIRLPPSLIRHGPCATLNMEEQYFHGYRDINVPCKGLDFAQGFEISHITKEGKCWLKMMDETQKERNWPSAKTVKKIRTLKNEVVAIAFCDDKITNCPLQWRISYTLWERELVWSFHNVQMHCYMILKSLLKVKLFTIFSEITSYHLKNIVFWESVDSSSEMFHNRQLLLLLKKCLSRLGMSIKKKRLNHFIDRDRNLFLAKLNDKKARLKMIFWLDVLILSISHNQELLSSVMNYFGDGKVHTLYHDYGPRTTAFISKAAGGTRVREEYIKRTMKCLELAFNVSQIKFYIFRIRDVHIIRYWIDKLDDMKKLGVQNTFVKIAQNTVRSRNWLITAAKNANMGIPIDYYTDALAGRLYFCTYLIRYGRFEEAAGIICEFLETSPKLLAYVRLCPWYDAYNGIHVENGQANHAKIESSSLDLSEEEPFPFVLDVIANPLEINIFPPIIQIQSTMANRSVILPPIVYMYYLKVLCDIGLHRNADNSLQRLSDTTNQYVSKTCEIGPLNMLGHAYLLFKKYEDAYRCFLESIRCTYRRNYPNSVYYLLLLLIFQAGNAD